MPARLAKIVARLDKRQARLLAEQASSYRSISAHGITMHFAPKKSRFANELWDRRMLREIEYMGVRGAGPAYFKDVCVPVLDIAARTSSLRSAERGDLFVMDARSA